MTYHPHFPYYHAVHFRGLMNQMKKKTLLLCLVAGILCGLPAELFAEVPERPILAVMTIEARSDAVKAELTDLESATDYLRALLVKSRRFVVVDKGRMESGKQRILQQLKRESHSECYDEKCRIELGRALAADTVLNCTVSNFGSSCSLSCEMVPLDREVTSSAAIAEFVCRQEAFRVALNEAAAQLADDMNPQGGEEQETDGDKGAGQHHPFVKRALELFFPQHQTRVVRVHGSSSPAWNLSDHLLASGRLQVAYVFTGGLRVSMGLRHAATVITEPADDWDLTPEIMVGYDHRYFGVGLGLAYHRIEPADEMQAPGLVLKTRLGSEEGLNMTMRFLELARTEDGIFAQYTFYSQLPVHGRVYLYADTMMDFVTMEVGDTNGHAIGGIKIVLLDGSETEGRVEISLGTGVAWTWRTAEADDWDSTERETMWSGQVGIDWRY